MNLQQNILEIKEIFNEAEKWNVAIQCYSRYDFVPSHVRELIEEAVSNINKNNEKVLEIIDEISK